MTARTKMYIAIVTSDAPIPPAEGTTLTLSRPTFDALEATVRAIVARAAGPVIARFYVYDASDGTMTEQAGRAIIND